MRRARRRKRRTRAFSPYNLIPIAAMAIFLVVSYLSTTGLGGIALPRLTLKDFSLTENKTTINQLPSAPDYPRDIAETGMPSEVSVPDSNIKGITVSSTGGDVGEGQVFIQNLTDLTLNIDNLFNVGVPVSLTKKGVQVLVVHTHGSESYTQEPGYEYECTDNDRTTDTNFNIVRVGDELTNILNSRGVETLHIRDIFDKPSYSGSYTRSLEAITNAIKNNPSIKVVIDVHRDSMVAKNGTKYKTVAEIDGKPAAQLMFVTGSNAGGLSHESWQKNLGFHMNIQKQMNNKYPGIMRPIILRKDRFNQHVGPGSMLLEVGTSGNALTEALLSVGLFANNLADMLLK